MNIKKKSVESENRLLIPYVRMDMLALMQRNTPPICFHCGQAYARDEKYCTETHSTWMPSCVCINKPGIRIVTGGEIIIEDE